MDKTTGTEDPLKACCILHSYDYLNRQPKAYDLACVRGYRDRVLSKTDEGKALIEKYYKTSEEFVATEFSATNTEKAAHFVLDILEEIVQSIEAGKHETTVELTNKMLHDSIEILRTGSHQNTIAS